jgi:hypothetical protein
LTVSASVRWLVEHGASHRGQRRPNLLTNARQLDGALRLRLGGSQRSDALQRVGDAWPIAQVLTETQTLAQGGPRFGVVPFRLRTTGVAFIYAAMGRPIVRRLART